MSAVSRPTNFAPGGNAGGDEFVVLVTNAGMNLANGDPLEEVPLGSGLGDPVTVTDELPVGVEALPGATGTDELGTLENSPDASFNSACEVDGEERKISCTYSGVVQVDDALVVTFPVRVSASPPDSCPAPPLGPEVLAPAVSCVENVVRVAGGGAAVGAVARTPTLVSPAHAVFGVSPGGATTALSSSQAGAHADLTVSTALNTEGVEGATVGNLKNTTYDLPPGFAGDLVDTPACAAADFLREECPSATQVGVTATILDISRETNLALDPVYNLAPEPGEVAKLGFDVRSNAYEGDVKVREPGEGGIQPEGGPGEAYGLKTTFYNVTGVGIDIDNVSLSVWGAPGSPVHDALRWKHGAGGTPGGESEAIEVPYLSNPTSCGTGPLRAAFSVTSWQEPSESQSPPPTYMPFAAMSGCDALVMAPSLTAEVSTDKASAATGLEVATKVPQTYGNAQGVSTPTLYKELVALPEGMTVNPSSGAGLAACSEAQLAEETAVERTAEEKQTGHGCPVSSKLATVKITSPSLKEEAVGQVFLATPAPFGEAGRNPFKSLLAVYLVARIESRGVLIKAPGEIEANPVTGQLTTTFEDLPPLPFSLATFSFNQGANAPLVTPPVCGNYIVTAALTPVSNLSQTLTPLIPPFTITNGFEGGACPSGTPPFAPQVAGGTNDNDAGGYSPFYIRISRDDGEQEITGFSSVLPPGLTANLNGVGLCSTADVEAARSVTGGQEEAAPSCPPGSEIGATIAEAGVGSVLAQTPGKLYLGEGFDGAPFSLVSITSAKVGPFDLGTVVVHLPLEINPETAVVSIPAGAADQIPHIIKGIVIHVRNIRVYVNRSKFMLNPTGCNPSLFSATAIGGGAEPANPADNTPVSVSDPFQAADCQSLAFAPKFAVSTAGHASKADGASLTFKVSYPANAIGSQSWFSAAKFDIPKQLPARLETLQRACLAQTFEKDLAACPAASIIGHAVVHTQILPVPLEGPVYFVSYGGAKFPDAVMLLKGYGITIELHGETFINKKTGVTSATFSALPDVPFESIEVNVPTGRYSEFGANLPAKDDYNLCGQKLVMPVAFKAANGTEIHQNTPVTVTGCPKHKTKKKTKKRKPAHTTHKKH